MNILTSYTLKYLWLNKKRTGVTILGVILSSALICGVILLGISFQKMMIARVIADTGNVHALFSAVPFEKVKYIAQNSAVEQTMLSVELGSAKFGNPKEDRPYVYIYANDAAWFEHQPVKLIAGRLPRSAAELLISQPMAVGSGLALQPGSHLSVTLGQRVAADGQLVKTYSRPEAEETFYPGKTSTYVVVGVMESSFDEIELPAAYAAYTFLDPATLGANDTVNVSILARDPGNLFNHIDTTMRAIATSAGLPASVHIQYNGGLLAWLGEKSDVSFKNFFMEIIASAVLLIMTGSALVIFNAFSISIGERKKQFGMFASVGATAVQIRGAVLTEALIIGAIGIPLGILGAIIGVGITLRLTQGIVTQLSGVEQGMQRVVSPLVIGLTFVFSAITILLSAWIAARRAARVSPIEAIRQSAEIREGKPGQLKTNPLIRRLFGFEGELALKALKRDRRRYRTTILSLMISIVLFVVFNAILLYATASARIDNASVNYDLWVMPNASSSKAAAFVEQVVRLPEVQEYSQVRCAGARFLASAAQLTGQAQQILKETGGPGFSADGKVQIPALVCTVSQAELKRSVGKLGLDPQQLASPTPSAILINHAHLRQGKLSEYDLLTLKPGDRLTVSAYPKSDRTHPDGISFMINAVTAETPLGISQPSTNIVLMISDSVFDEQWAFLSRYGLGAGELFFKSADPGQLTASVKQLYKTTIGGSLPYHSMAESNQNDNLTGLMIKLFFYGFLALVTLIGVTNIINTLDTNIKLRRREIAMLRSVGLTPGGLLRMLRYESLFYGLTALFYGLPVGIALSYLIYLQFSRVSYFDFKLPWEAILLCVAGVLLIVFATMMVSAAMIRNDNIVDILNEENL